MRALLCALTALALAACAGSAPAPDATRAAFPTSTAGLATMQVRVGARAIDVEVAATPDQRAQGLSGRVSLPADAGMLFDMGQVTTPDFWMKDMRFALDLVWIGADRRVLGVTPGVPPQPGVPDAQLLLYRPPSPVRYVLEVNSGAAARLGLTAGAQLAFNLPAASATPAR